MPATEIGEACVSYLRRFGVDTRYVARGGDRLGPVLPRDRRRPARLEGRLRPRPHLAAQRHGRRLRLGRHPRGGRLAALLGHRAGVRGRPSSMPSRPGSAWPGNGVTVSAATSTTGASCGRPEAAARAMTALMPLRGRADRQRGGRDHTVFGIAAEGSDVVRGELDTRRVPAVVEPAGGALRVRTVATTLRSSISASINGWAGHALRRRRTST